MTVAEFNKRYRIESRSSGKSGWGVKFLGFVLWDKTKNDYIYDSESSHKKYLYFSNSEEIFEWVENNK